MSMTKMEYALMMALSIAAGILLSMFANGCSTNSHEVKKLDTSLEAKGQVGERTVGITSENELILQEERTAADELRIQESVNEQLLGSYGAERFELKRCRVDISDPRLGGNGIIPPISEIDGMKAPETIREEIGLAEDGQVKVVKKSYYKDKLHLERAYEKSLTKMIAVTTRHKEECEYKMGQARREFGLPSQRYTGKGYFTNGDVWIQNQRVENSLDDAFEFKARQEGH